MVRFHARAIVPIHTRTTRARVATLHNSAMLGPDTYARCTAMMKRLCKAIILSYLILSYPYLILSQ